MVNVCLTAIRTNIKRAIHSIVQVVQSLFEMMDTSRETYESMLEQKNYLEDLWNKEKSKTKAAQKVKCVYVCVYLTIPI